MTESETKPSSSSASIAFNPQLLPEDLQYGFRLLNQLCAQQKTDVARLEDVTQHSARHYKTIKEIETSFTSQSYTSITDVVSDIRLFIEGIYREFGMDNWVSKSARNIEQVMEQKLALLPRILQQSCTIEATNLRQGKIIDCSSEPRRRSRNSGIGTSDTPLILQLKNELEANLKEEQRIQKEKTRLREEQRKAEREKMLKHLVVFKDTVLTMDVTEQIKHCWRLPCVGMLICMMKNNLGIDVFNYTEFELATFFIDKSYLFSQIFTCVLSNSPTHRKSFVNSKCFYGYEDWSVLLKNKVEKWFNYAEKHGEQLASENFGFGSNFFEYFGLKNPLTTDECYLKLPLNEKLIILNALCEAALEKDVNMQNLLSEMTILRRQELFIGEDAEHNIYSFFPQFGNTDIRVYRYSKKKFYKKDGASFEMMAWDMPSLEELIDSFPQQVRKNTRVSDLKETLVTLRDELATRKDTFAKCRLDAHLRVMLDYYGPDFNIDKLST